MMARIRKASESHVIHAVNFLDYYTGDKKRRRNRGKVGSAAWRKGEIDFPSRTP